MATVALFPQEGIGQKSEAMCLKLFGEFPSRCPQDPQAYPFWAARVPIPRTK